MDSMDALRFLTLSFVDGCEDYLDEDTYDSVKLIIEKTPSNKLLKKIDCELFFVISIYCGWGCEKSTMARDSILSL